MDIHDSEKGKWAVVRNLINAWLKDPTLYCGNCDSDYYPNHPPCCEEPVIGDNWKFCKDIVEAVKDRKKNLNNEYAADKKMTLRATITLPKRLLFVLEKFFAGKKEKLFDNRKEMHQFMRRFPQFRMPIKI
jgi:hypothetical protein